jgi:ribosomal protein S18 acetylase RimI-like enzyme
MYSFRYATEEDVDAVVALVQSAYRGNDSRLGWTTEADLLGGQRTDSLEVSELIRKPKSFILLCQREAELMACVHMHNRGDYAYLGMFAVRPSRQGRGIGGLLLERVEKLAFENWQSIAVQMTVISLREDLIAWYVRRGYRSTEEFIPFPYGNERFGLPKRDGLKMLVLRKECGEYFRTNR